MNQANSRKVLYLLGAGVLISLILNMFLFYTLYSEKNKAVSAIEELTGELSNLKNETIHLTYITEDIDIPMEFTTNVDEIIEVEVPLDTTVTAEITSAAESYITLGGITHKIIIPINATVAVPIKETVMVELPIRGEVRVSGNLNAPKKLELKMESTLEELGLAEFVDRIIGLLRRLLRSL